jgi:hypothetical protein
MSELEPCPFCGGKAEYIEDDGNHHYAECEDCGTSRGGFAYTPTEFRTLGIEGIRERTSEAWNTRAAPKVKALEWFKLRELCHVSSPCANLEYRVLEQRLDFFVTINGERFGSSNSVGLAKAMAQGHYEKLILEALEI